MLLRSTEIQPLFSDLFLQRNTPSFRLSPFPVSPDSLSGTPTVSHLAARCTPWGRPWVAAIERGRLLVAKLVQTRAGKQGWWEVLANDGEIRPEANFNQLHFDPPHECSALRPIFRIPSCLSLPLLCAHSLIRCGILSGERLESVLSFACPSSRGEVFAFTVTERANLSLLGVFSLSSDSRLRRKACALVIFHQGPFDLSPQLHELFSFFWERVFANALVFHPTFDLRRKSPTILRPLKILSFFF